MKEATENARAYLDVGTRLSGDDMCWRGSRVLRFASAQAGGVGTDARFIGASPFLTWEWTQDAFLRLASPPPCLPPLSLWVYLRRLHCCVSWPLGATLPNTVHLHG